MNKKKTAVAAVLIASALTMQVQAQQKPSQPTANVKHHRQSSEMSGFLKKNPSVANVSWKSGDDIILRLKSGKVQSFNLADTDQKQTFEKQYGTAPAAPPPPPPFPPPPPPPPTPVHD